MRQDRAEAYQAWVWGELLLLGLLSASLTLFVSYPSLRETYSLPELRLFLDTAVMLAATVVAVLAGARFSVEGRWLDILLCAGFAVAAATSFAFDVVPVLGGSHIPREEAWTGIAGGVVSSTLIVAAAFSRGRITARRRAIWDLLLAAGVFLLVLWLGAHMLGDRLPEISAAVPSEHPALLTAGFAFDAVLSLAALVGFGVRFRAHGEDLDRWLALGATLGVFAALHYVFTPLISTASISQGDFLRLLSYGILMAGVWRAIRYAEFGRAVAEERARVAREIHDGLAQYLFSISTHLSMLKGDVASQPAIERLREAARAAQQEARFAVLALSSASGNAPFDSQLRRYVDLLTADGALDVDLEIQPGVQLAPDEQIEIFRIVQEGLGNVRRHANASRAGVWIGESEGRRLLVVEDDGRGFKPNGDGGGQGLKNMVNRAGNIGGDFSYRSRPGKGTALEVTLRS